MIHQIWFDLGNGSSPREDWCKTWRDMNPSWSYKLWNESECRDLIRDEYPFFLKTYESYKYDIERIDSVRYFILHKFGGFYVDTDAICLKSLDQVLQDFPGDLGVVESGSKVYGVECNNFFIYSKPPNDGHEVTRVDDFWLTVFEEMMERSLRTYSMKTIEVLEMTGPFMLNSVITSSGVGFTLYPWKLFNSEDGLLTDSMYIYHFSLVSWTGPGKFITHLVTDRWVTVITLIALCLLISLECKIFHVLLLYLLWNLYHFTLYFLGRWRTDRLSNPRD
jgi:mannosyltransferase OCH1-like enzyme